MRKKNVIEKLIGIIFKKGHKKHKTRSHERRHPRFYFIGASVSRDDARTAGLNPDRLTYEEIKRLGINPNNFGDSVTHDIQEIW